jgi:hypothetical protein
MPVSKRRSRSLIALLCLAAAAIFVLPASQASAVTQSNACVNNLIANQSSSIPITMTANTAPSPVEVGSSLTLKEIKQKLEVPPAVFLSGYNLGFLTPGKNEIPTKVRTTIAATNTTPATQETNLVETKAITTITDPDNNFETVTPGTEATPGAVEVTYNNQTWTASAAGTIEFREATLIEPLAPNPPGFTTTVAGVTIEAIVGPGGAIKAKFGCDPGTVVEAAEPSTIVRQETAATFASAEAIPPKPKFALNLTKSGTGTGSFECDSGGGFGACAAEYGEGTVVKVKANAGTGSVFKEFSGDCSGASCELTMNAAHTVNAEFNLELVALSASVAGEGTVECEVNASPASCNGSYNYGSTIKAVATPAAENNLGSLTGSGSAAGKCSVETKQCNFTLTAPSSVAAVFEAAGSKAKTEGKVYGEVPQTTSIQSGCASVFLGKFIPGEAKNYENNCFVTLTSTGTETTLTASDETGVDTGFLTQKLKEIPHNYTLASPLLVGALDVGGEGGTGPPGGALVAPVKLLTRTHPITKDTTAVGFRQAIGEKEPLHTGVYAKTITLTLQQTTP